jgi:hypothetical protein
MWLLLIAAGLRDICDCIILKILICIKHSGFSAVLQSFTFSVGKLEETEERTALEDVFR